MESRRAGENRHVNFSRANAVEHGLVRRFRRHSAIGDHIGDLRATFAQRHSEMFAGAIAARQEHVAAGEPFSHFVRQRMRGVILRHVVHVESLQLGSFVCRRAHGRDLPNGGRKAELFQPEGDKSYRILTRE